jgi:hypothetical protein
MVCAAGRERDEHRGGRAVRKPHRIAVPIDVRQLRGERPLSGSTADISTADRETWSRFLYLFPRKIGFLCNAVIFFSLKAIFSRKEIKTGPFFS